jgi:hypothetical protein
MNHRRRLTKAELRAMGASPGLMARRYDASSAGHAHLEQLTAAAKVARTDWTGRAA